MGLCEGRRALVTGAASGIGAAISRRLAEEGARVVLSDRDGDAVHAEAERQGAVAVELDVVDPQAVDDAFEQAARLMGGLDTVVLNAGIGSLKPLEAYTDVEWHRLVDVNMTGVFNGLRSCVSHLRSAGGGSVVTVASVSGVRPTRGEAPYSAAKAGVVALTRSAALEFGPDRIRVNCVSPGVVDTPLTALMLAEPSWRAPLEEATPLRRVGIPDDVAGVVVFLCSDAAAYVTGQNLLVDGGASLSNAQVDHVLRELLGEP